MQQYPIESDKNKTPRTGETVTASETKTKSAALSPWRVMWNEIYKDKIALTALIIFFIIMISTFVMAAFLDADYAIRVDLRARNRPPSSEFFMGTDSGGRDMVNMMILGARTSILVAFSVTIIGSAAGIFIGLVSGFYGGHTDNVIMRIVDTIMMLPQLLMIILLITLTPYYTVVDFVLIMSLFSWMGTSRIIRAMALQQRNLDYVSASKTLGTRNVVIMLREVLPNLVPVICVNMTLTLAGNMGIETGLTFLGFGLPFGIPSLGALIAHARFPIAMQERMWQWLPAAILVVVLMLCVYCVGQALSRASDVRSRRG